MQAVPEDRGLMTNPQRLRQRIEAAYMGNARVDEPRGAVAWFAGQCNVDDRTVQRWLAGDREPSGPAMAVLSLLEERAASTGWGQ